MDLSLLLISIDWTWFTSSLREIVVGLVCLVFGTVFGNFWKTRKEQRKRTKEVIDEKRVPVCTEALKLISRLRSALIQDTLEDSFNFVRQQDAWFWQNIAFLPHKFSDKWLSIKLGLRRAILFEKVQAAMVDGPDRDRRIEELVDLQSFMDQLAKEAEREIRDELCLPEVKIERPPKAKKS